MRFGLAAAGDIVAGGMTTGTECHNLRPAGAGTLNLLFHRVVPVLSDREFKSDK